MVDLVVPKLVGLSVRLRYNEYFTTKGVLLCFKNLIGIKKNIKIKNVN